ncbi:MAG: butyrate kinase [Marinilabiliaceae bacterium]|nr:butyrate kinase [Marinilabiliaceae bacterium]
MSKQYLILTINPGSSSTKIAVFEGRKSIFLKNIKHNQDDLNRFATISDQYVFRRDIILKELSAIDINPLEIVAIVGRGGLVKPIESGIYEVNEKLKHDLRVGVQGQHASNLGGLIADELIQTFPNARAYIADPVVVDELSAVARITGHPMMNRRSIFHALNQKAIARRYAKSLHKSYDELNLIVAHMGGGISVGAHEKGKVVDVNNALDGFGPFSPERAGTLPSGALVDLCFSGTLSHDEIKKIINGKGGLMAHFGTNQAHEVAIMAQNGNEKAQLVLDAMAYQTAKSIGACATVLKGVIDGILITGGIANNKKITEYIIDMVDFIAPVIVYPGEDEMQAMAENALAVLEGEIECKVYT